MPWNNVDLSGKNWDELGDMTWEDVKVVEMDMELKTRIKHDFPRVHYTIIEGIRDNTFDPTVPLYPELKRHIEYLYGMEIDGNEDPFKTLSTLETTIPILTRADK